MSTFLSIMLLWASYVAAVVWPCARDASKPVKWTAATTVLLGFALSYYVWMAQHWTPPAIWIMRLLSPITPSP